MFDWLRKQLRRTEINTLPLSFRMDRTEDDQHAVQVFKHWNGEDILIEDVPPLWQYGYQEKEETPDGDVVYVLAEKDRQMLLSLRSMNPKIDKNGRLLFSFAPPMLNYWRSKDNMGESEASEKLKVRDKPLKVTAQVDFDPKEGITVHTGFEDPETHQLQSVDALQTTADGEYARIGDTFIPIPKPPSEAAQKWWEQSVTKVSKQDIPEFFQRDLVLLKREFTAVLTDMASQIQIISEPFKPVVKVDKDKGGWLDFEVSYQAGGFTLPHGLLNKSADEPFVQLDEMTWIKKDVKAVRQTENQLKAMEAEVTAKGFRAQVSQFASLEEFIENIGGRAELSAAYQAFLDQLTGFSADDSFQLSKAAERQFKKIGITLRPYQRAGIHWLDWLHSNHLHGLLADDMGLGKTLQSICVLRRAYEKSRSRQHSLILSPKSVIHHWERELNTYYPHLRVYPYHGPNRNRKLLQAVEPIVFISTYATAANDLEYLSKVPFYYIVLDEATRIKNPQARRTQAVKALNGAHRLALSGTPVENRPSEMWSIFDFLMRGHLGRFGTFKRKYEDEIAGGNNIAAEQLGRRVRPFMLRRLKENVAKDLPAKIEMDEWCALTAEQSQLYGGLQDEVRRIRQALRRGEQVNYTTSILPVLMRLKQICDHPALVNEKMTPVLNRSEKFDWIVEKVREIKSQGEQVVIFSHFLGMLTLLEKALQQDNTSYIRIDGSTNNRQALIDNFNEGQKVVALCSLGATSQGINLTSANHVIHADRWWNPAIEDQATDRVHRIGQDKVVYVYRIMVQGTLEERIEELLDNKRMIADQIVDAAGAGARQWTKDELLELLRPLE